jgi:hypothetical protein
LSFQLLLLSSSLASLKPRDELTVHAMNGRGKVRVVGLGVAVANDKIGSRQIGRH